MKTIIFFLLMFSFCYADEWTKADFDYREYLLEGDYKEELKISDELSLFSIFMMRDGYILYSTYPEGGYSFMSQVVPEGEYELKTKAGTEIKVVVGEKSMVKEFYFKKSKWLFERKEEMKIGKNLCEEGKSFILYNYAFDELEKPREIGIFFKESGQRLYDVLIFEYMGNIMLYWMYGLNDFVELDFYGVYEMNKMDYYYDKHIVTDSYSLDGIVKFENENDKLNHKRILTTKDCVIEYLDEDTFRMEYDDTKEIIKNIF